MSVSTRREDNSDVNMKPQQISPETARKLKYLSLLTLTAQNAILGLSMRYSRTREGDMFYEATAVLMAELVKFFTCLFLVYKDVEYDFNDWKQTMYQAIWVNKVDTIKVILFFLIYKKMLFYFEYFRYAYLHSYTLCRIIYCM